MERQPYLRLQFENASGRSLSTERLVSTIKSQLKNHAAYQGCRMPPVRALAHELGISKNTVQTVYEELCAQGILESRDRTGIFVKTENSSKHLLESAEVPKPKLKPLLDSVSFSPKPSEKLWLSSVFVDPRILPVEKLTACFRSILKYPGIPDFHDPLGFKPLREKIASRLRDRGIDVTEDEVITTSGSQQALDLVCRSLSTKKVATENPSYYLGRRLFEMNGIETVGLPIDPFVGIDETEWRRLLSKERPGLTYLTTSYQNPNGYSYTSAEISKIVSWAQEFEFGILEDDWGSEMLSGSEFKPGLRALGGSNVLYMNSFTKKVLPSLRVGYLVANKDTVETFRMAKRVSTIAVPGIIEAALHEFLDRGYYDTHLKHTQEELDIRYEHCLSLLREKMPEDIRFTTSGGGPVLWIEVPKRINLELLRERLEKRDVSIALSDAAYFGKPLNHGFKIGYAYLNTSEMEQALSILSVEFGKFA